MTLISDHPELDFTRWQGDTCFITSAQSIQLSAGSCWVWCYVTGGLGQSKNMNLFLTYLTLHTAHLCQFDGINPLQEAARLLEFHLRLFVSRKNSLFNV